MGESYKGFKPNATGADSTGSGRGSSSGSTINGWDAMDQQALSVLSEEPRIFLFKGFLSSSA